MTKKARNTKRQDQNTDKEIIIKNNISNAGILANNILHLKNIIPTLPNKEIIKSAKNAKKTFEKIDSFFTKLPNLQLQNNFPKQRETPKNSINDIIKIFEIKNIYSVPKTINELLKRIKDNPLEWIKELQTNVRKWLKENAETPTETATKNHARKVRLFKETIKISNQILGFTCYFLDYYQTNQIEKLLSILNIPITENIIKDIQKYRTKAKGFITNLGKKEISNKQFNSKFRIIENSHLVMSSLKLPKRRKVKELINRMIENNKPKM